MTATANTILEARQEIARLGGGSCTQEDMATMLELTPSMISKMERGVVPVAPRTLVRVSRILARLRAKHL